MSAEHTDRVGSREQVVETMRRKRDLSGAGMKSLDPSGIKLTGLTMSAPT